jgi:hypothetical protein
MLSKLFHFVLWNWLIILINSQYQIPSYQPPQNRFGSDILHYRITTTLRTTTPKQDPDSFFFGNFKFCFKLYFNKIYIKSNIKVFFLYGPLC